MGKGKVVIVSGLIASGKTTISGELASALGGPPKVFYAQEPDEKEGRNPYLSDYYKDPKRWALPMQLHLLGVRYRQHQHAQWHVLDTGEYAVLDSSYWQDTAFARLQLKLELMSDAEFATYSTMYQIMTAAVLLPNVCLRILTTPETSIRRIESRMEKQTGRKCESAVSLSYLQGLDREIDHMVAVLRSQGVTVLDVPWDEDRDTPEIRRAAVEGLASRIRSIEPLDPFLDLHRRSV